MTTVTSIGNCYVDWDSVMKRIDIIRQRNGGDLSTVRRFYPVDYLISQMDISSLGFTRAECKQLFDLAHKLGWSVSQISRALPFSYRVTTGRKQEAVGHVESEFLITAIAEVSAARGFSQGGAAMESFCNVMGFSAAELRRALAWFEPAPIQITPAGFAAVNGAAA